MVVVAAIFGVEKLIGRAPSRNKCHRYIEPCKTGRLIELTRKVMNKCGNRWRQSESNLEEKRGVVNALNVADPNVGILLRVYSAVVI